MWWYRINGHLWLCALVSMQIPGKYFGVDGQRCQQASPGHNNGPQQTATIAQRKRALERQKIHLSRQLSIVPPATAWYDSTVATKQLSQKRPRNRWRQDYRNLHWRSVIRCNTNHAQGPDRAVYHHS